MKIVFMGSADFGLPALQNLLTAGHNVVAIVSTPPRKQGRGLHVKKSAIHTFADQHALGPVFTPESLLDQVFIDQLKNCHADVFVVVAFRILPPAVFTIPPLGTINIHASLLPHYRGPAPIHRAIQNGEKESGITIFKIDTGIDTGNIILQQSVLVDDNETTPELYGRLQQLGATALPAALDFLQKGSIDFQQQDSALASKAPKLKKEEGNIPWHESALTIFNMIRAFKPFPGTYTFLNGERLGVEMARIAAINTHGTVPGTVCAVDHESFTICCGTHALQIEQVKPEGKKSMSAAAYLCGTTVHAGMQCTRS